MSEMRPEVPDMHQLISLSVVCHSVFCAVLPFQWVLRGDLSFRHVCQQWRLHSLQCLMHTMHISDLLYGLCLDLLLAAWLHNMRHYMSDGSIYRQQYQRGVPALLVRVQSLYQFQHYLYVLHAGGIHQLLPEWKHVFGVVSHWLL